MKYILLPFRYVPVQINFRYKRGYFIRMEADSNLIRDMATKNYEMINLDYRVSLKYHEIEARFKKFAGNKTYDPDAKTN